MGGASYQARSPVLSPSGLPCPRGEKQQAARVPVPFRIPCAGQVLICRNTSGFHSRTPPLRFCPHSTPLGCLDRGDALKAGSPAKEHVQSLLWHLGWAAAAAAAAAAVYSYGRLVRPL